MKRIVAIAAAAVLAFALAGCGSPASSSAPASSEASSSPSAAPEPSPSASVASQTSATVKWTDVKSADEAAKGAGFDKFGVMEKVTVDDTEYKDPKFAYADGVAQATYEHGAIALIVRKADGAHQAPLTDYDKTEFANKWTKEYEGFDVTLYGPAKGAATVFDWVDGTKDYCVTYQGLGGEDVTVDTDDVAAIVKAIKEADGTPAAQPAQTEAASNQVSVPDVVGMSAADAGAAIEAAGLSPDGDTEGTVVSQTPAAGTMVDPGDTVSIAANDESGDEVAVPNVIGMDAEDAGAAIEAAGLTPDGASSGTVIGQTPEAGVMLDPGDTVSIAVSDGADDADDDGDGESDEISVPDVIGMDAQDAGAAIEAAGLSPDGESEGTVVSQSPAAGTLVGPGDTVSIATS